MFPTLSSQIDDNPLLTHHPQIAATVLHDLLDVLMGYSEVTRADYLPI
jgi:hypothetical protein